MAEIIGNQPVRTCNSCGCMFKYSQDDIRRDVGQYWAGFWKGGWLTKEYRYVTCPGCGKEIVLG